MLLPSIRWAWNLIEIFCASMCILNGLEEHYVLMEYILNTYLFIYTDGITTTKNVDWMKYQDMKFSVKFYEVIWKTNAKHYFMRFD